MEIKLTPKESEEYFFHALCNGIGMLSNSGLEFDYDDKDYDAAKKNLKAKDSNQTICREDVWMEILRMGKKLRVNDIDGDGEYTREITLKEVHERVQNTQLNHLQDMIDENDDAVTADVILQRVFFDDLIFG